MLYRICSSWFTTKKGFSKIFLDSILSSDPFCAESTYPVTGNGRCLSSPSQLRATLALCGTCVAKGKIQIAGGIEMSGIYLHKPQPFSFLHPLACRRGREILSMSHILTFPTTLPPASTVSLCRGVGSHPYTFRGLMPPGPSLPAPSRSLPSLRAMQSPPVHMAPGSLCETIGETGGLFLVFPGDLPFFWRRSLFASTVVPLYSVLVVNSFRGVASQRWLMKRFLFRKFQQVR